MQVFNLVFTVIFIANCQRMNVLPQIELATKSLDQSNNFNENEYDYVVPHPQGEVSASTTIQIVLRPFL